MKELFNFSQSTSIHDDNYDALYKPEEVSKKSV